MSDGSTSVAPVKTESLQILLLRQQLIMDRSDSQKKLSTMIHTMLEKEKEEDIRFSGLQGQIALKDGHIAEKEKEITIVRTDSERHLRAMRTLADSEKDDLSSKLQIVQKQSGSQLMRLQKELVMTRTDSEVSVKKGEDSRMGLNKRVQVSDM